MPPEHGFAAVAAMIIWMVILGLLVALGRDPADPGADGRPGLEVPSLAIDGWYLQQWERYGGLPPAPAHRHPVFRDPADAPEEPEMPVAGGMPGRRSVRLRSSPAEPARMPQGGGQRPSRRQAAIRAPSASSRTSAPGSSGSSLTPVTM